MPPMVFPRLREWDGVGIESLNNLLWLWNLLLFPEWVIPTSSFSVCTIMHKTLGSSILAQYQCLPRYGVVRIVKLHSQPINYHILSLYTLCCINAQEARSNQIRNSCRKYDKGKIKIGKTTRRQERGRVGTQEGMWNRLEWTAHSTASMR